MTDRSVFVVIGALVVSGSILYLRFLSDGSVLSVLVGVFGFLGMIMFITSAEAPEIPKKEKNEQTGRQ